MGLEKPPNEPPLVNNLYQLLFTQDELMIYQANVDTIVGQRSFYYFSEMNNAKRVIGPFNSVLDATKYYEKVKTEREAIPNVIHVNFKTKTRLAGSPPNFIPQWTICECGQHYDQVLRNQCPNCGRYPVRLL